MKFGDEGKKKRAGLANAARPSTLHLPYGRRERTIGPATGAAGDVAGTGHRPFRRGLSPCRDPPPGHSKPPPRAPPSPRAPPHLPTRARPRSLSPHSSPDQPDSQPHAA